MKLTTTERTRKYRAALKASGLRPVQIWVPDTHRASFAEECYHQSALRSDAHEKEMLNWLADVADTNAWDGPQEDKK